MTDLHHKALRLLWRRMPYRDIAVLFGVSEDELLRQARRMGLKQRYRMSYHYWTTQEEQIAWRMYEQGCTNDEIGAAVGVNAEAVRRKLYEIKRRQKAS